MWRKSCYLRPKHGKILLLFKVDLQSIGLWWHFISECHCIRKHQSKCQADAAGTFHNQKLHYTFSKPKKSHFLALFLGLPFSFPMHAHMTLSLSGVLSEKTRSREALNASISVANAMHAAKTNTGMSWSFIDLASEQHGARVTCAGRVLLSLSGAPRCWCWRSSCETSTNTPAEAPQTSRCSKTSAFKHPTAFLRPYRL